MVVLSWEYKPHLQLLIILRILVPLSSRIANVSFDARISHPKIWFILKHGNRCITNSFRLFWLFTHIYNGLANVYLIKKGYDNFDFLRHVHFISIWRWFDTTRWVNVATHIYSPTHSQHTKTICLHFSLKKEQKKMKGVHAYIWSYLLS